VKLKVQVGSGDRVMGLTLPGVGLVLDTWLGPALGVILYVSSRIFSPAEEKLLAKYFPMEYPAYRGRVLLPWL